MPLDRFMIAPINTGLENDLKPFAIPDDAFAQLDNAYIFRGRVRKRFGSFLLNQTVDPSVAQLYSRLRIHIGNTDVFGTIVAVLPGTIFKVGQLFSLSNEIFTVVVLGNPGVMLTTGTTPVHTFDTTTGTVTITGAPPLTPVFWYPAEPVMGLIQYELDAINNDPTYAFDTQFAYQFTAAGWDRLGLAIWTGNNAQFFWGRTFQGATADANVLYITNYNPPDLIKYWDGAVWANLNPQFDANPAHKIVTARLIMPFKDRLVLLNTIETLGAGNIPYVNRARFSQNGSPLQADAWREDIPGKGGFLDAPTQEQIVSTQFLKDRLIVFFESSTWELVYTGNEILPFRWQQLNSELGVESMLSTVPFDKVLLGVGDVGVHACNGVNVERIDEKIPDEVFAIHNTDGGVERVSGIRDYFTELVYWTFPRTGQNAEDPFPKRILVYNYRTGSWAFNDDSITVFGYFFNVNNITLGPTWITVGDTTWEEAGFPWGSGSTQALFRQIIAGNQEGFTFICYPDVFRNAPALQITNMTVAGGTVTFKVIDHNLSEEDFILIENVVGITGINFHIYDVALVIDKDTFTITLRPDDVVAGAYLGGGTLARVSRIDILTKQYNFYAKDGRNATVQKTDFLVEKISKDEEEDTVTITVDYYASTSQLSLLDEGEATGALLGTGKLETTPYDLYPLETIQTQLWHPMYLQAEGTYIQLNIYLSDEELIDPLIAFSDFQMHAMIFFAQPTSSRLQ